MLRFCLNRTVWFHLVTELYYKYTEYGNLKKKLTLKICKLQVIVVQRQVVLHGGKAAWSSSEVSHALMFTVKHLSEVICNRKGSDQASV